MLLEEAEEYGCSSEKPLAISCDVDHFVKALMEVNGFDVIRQGLGFVKENPHHRLGVVGDWRPQNPPRRALAAHCNLEDGK
ncbi:hypothetical protein Vadar_022053 [Vaccinium darrowii]|uniref:Uncharacterized protein n=1 Tax=Vaccinium darrowii TaxID=229202 RepID=A0ACB7ZEC6_9ERIC|nr:hypothetical protein Vadar_022053 [Vaccinium darrowii]